MKDLHNHILPGLDDGCKNEEESLKVLNDLINSGINEVVFTPHYVFGTKYVADNKKKKDTFLRIKKIIEKNKLPIKVYLGNEILFCDNILELLEKGEILPINNSKNLLIEFPMMNLPHNDKNVFDELINSGYNIILAHPERYYFVREDINVLNDFVSMGVHLQGNYTSLFGKYGRTSKKILKKLLKRGMIDILASDTHHEVIGSEVALRKKLKWYLKEEDINQLLFENFDLIINNKK